MAIFLSDALNQLITFDMTEEWKTSIVISESGIEQRRAKWGHVRRHVHISPRYLYGVNGDTLWDFYHARRGSYEAFSWFVPFSDAYIKELVGIGDGSTVTFNIPGKLTSARTMYEDGEENASISYSTGGTDGVDRVTFSVAPAAGAIIEISFTGYLRIWCRFANDKLNRPFFDTTVRDWGLDLIEVKVAS